MSEDHRSIDHLAAGLACVGLFAVGVMGIAFATDLARPNGLGAAACLAVSALAFGMVIFFAARR